MLISIMGMNTRVVARRMVVGGLLFSYLFVYPSAVFAQGQSSSDVIAQNFATDLDPSKIVAGTIVSTMSNKTGYVDLATTDNVDQLLGVVSTIPLVSLSSNNKKIPVVITGTTTVLVSDLNGNIKSGDKITASPIAGVGMLATSDSQIVGSAQASFEGNKGTTRHITDKNGKIHTVHIQRLLIQVGVAYYTAPGSNFLPPFVQDLANSIAGRPVSLIRIILSTAILTIGLVFAIITAYASTRTTIAALGRNPLGSKVIIKGQYRTLLLAFGVIGGALLATYLLLVL